MSAYRFATHSLRGTAGAASSLSPLVLAGTVAGLIAIGVASEKVVAQSPYARRRMTQSPVPTPRDNFEHDPQRLPHDEHFDHFRKSYVLSSYVATRSQMDQTRREILSNEARSTESASAER
jgi:hypothetical protein